MSGFAGDVTVPPSSMSSNATYLCKYSVLYLRLKAAIIPASKGYKWLVVFAGKNLTVVFYN